MRKFSVPEAGRVPSTTARAPRRYLWLVANEQPQWLLKIGGEWLLEQAPQQARRDTADVVFRGGYVYDVDEPLALELIAAGFEDYLSGPPVDSYGFGLGPFGGPGNPFGGSV